MTPWHCRARSCINYTNEKLHQAFINEVFEVEKRVYIAEGLSPDIIVRVGPRARAADPRSD